MGWNRPSSRWRVVKRMRQPSVSGLASGTDRTGELGGVLEVVEDQQGVGPALQLVEGGAELLVRRTFENLGTQPAADLEPVLWPAARPR